MVSIIKDAYGYNGNTEETKLDETNSSRQNGLVESNANVMSNRLALALVSCAIT